MALSEDNMNGEAVRTAGEYLYPLIMTAEKAIAEQVKTAGEKDRRQGRRFSIFEFLFSKREEFFNRGFR